MNFIERIKDRITGKAPKGAKRSKYWRRVRKNHLKIFPECKVCGSKRKVQVHHVLPFHLFPDEELHHANLITLCENGKYKGINCHLAIGHLCDYRKINPSVRSDAAQWSVKLEK